MANNLHVTNGDWQAIETSAKPVLVDFWAEWCAPCGMFAPTFEKLAEKYGSELSFAKVNVDERPELAEHFAIRSIPTLLLLREGNEVDRWVGARPFDELARMLDRHTSAAVKE